MTNIAKHLLAASAAVLAAGGALAAAAGPAQARDVTVYAQPDEDALTRKVGYSDLDLASAAGQKALNSRVRSAVRYVCSPLVDMRFSRVHSDCTDFAWDGARPQMALATERARQLAATGTTSIAPVAVSVRALAR